MRNYREIWRYWDNHQNNKNIKCDKPNEVTHIASCPDFCPDELLPAVIAGTLELTPASQKSDNLYSYAQLVASSDLHAIILSVIAESELPSPEKQQKLNFKNVSSKQKVCLKTFKLMDIEQQIHAILSDLFLNPSSPKLFSLPILSDQISAIFSSLLFEIEFQRELVEALLCLPDYASSTLVVVKHVLLVSLAVHKSSLFSLCDVKGGMRANRGNGEKNEENPRRKSNSGIKSRNFAPKPENIQSMTLLEMIITRNCAHRTSFLKAMISLDQELLTPFIINRLQSEKIVFEVINEIREDRVFMETLKSILLHSDIIENMKSSLVGSWFPVRVTERVDRFLENAKYGDYELCLVVGCLLHVNGIPFDNSALKSISLENDKEILKGVSLKSEQKCSKNLGNVKKVKKSKKVTSVKSGNDDSVMCLDDTVEITSESESSEPEITESEIIEPELTEPGTPESQLTEESELDTEKVILSITASVICEIVPSINEEDSILFLWRLFIDRLKDTVTENFKKSAEHDPEKEAFVEMILLIAIYLSQDDRKKVVRILLQNPVVVKTGLSAVLRRHVNLGRKSLIIKPTQIKNLANLFSKNFYSEALAEYAICLPVTKNLTTETMSGNSFDILPADLVIEVLQERQNLNKETTNWVFEQIINAGFSETILGLKSDKHLKSKTNVMSNSIHPKLVILIEEFTKSCVKPLSSSLSNDETEHSFCEPFSESLIKKYLESGSAACQSLLIYYLLLYQDILLTNIKSVKNCFKEFGRQIVQYSGGIYDEIPYGLVLKHVGTELGVKMTSLLVKYQQHVCPRPEDLLLDTTPTSSKPNTQNFTRTTRDYEIKLKSLNSKTCDIKSWKEFNSVIPQKLWMHTINQLRNKADKNARFSKRVSYKELIEEPILALSVDPIYLKTRPIQLKFTLNILTSLLQANRNKYDVQLATLDQTDPSKSGTTNSAFRSLSPLNSLIEKQQLSQYKQASIAISAILHTQTATCCQMVIESSLLKGNSECSKIAANFLHEQIMADLTGNVLKLLVWQGFPLVGMKRFVDLVESCYISVDYLSDCFRSSNLERRIFGICLSSYLLEKHRTPNTLRTAKLALNVLYTTVLYSKSILKSIKNGHLDSPENSSSNTELLMILSETVLIDSVKRICDNCNSLVSEGVILLGYIDQFLTDSLSMESVHCESVYVRGKSGSTGGKIENRVIRIRKCIKETRRNLAMGKSI